MASSFSLARSASLGGARKRDPFGNHIDDVERALGDPGASSSGGGGGAWASEGGHGNGPGSYQDAYGSHMAAGLGVQPAYAGYGRPGPPATSGGGSGQQGPPGSPGHPPYGGGHQHQRSVGELYPSSMTTEGLMRTGMLPTSHGPPPPSNRSSFHGAPPPSPSSYAAAKLQAQQSPHMTSGPFPSSPQLGSHQQMPPPQQAQRQQQQQQPISALKYGPGPGGPPPPPSQQQQPNPYIPASPSQHAPPPPSASHPMSYSYSGGSASGASPSFGGRAQPPSSSWAEYSPRSTPQIEMRSSPVPPPTQQQQHYQAAYTPPSSTASPNRQAPYGPPANAGSNPYIPQNAGHPPPPPPPPQGNPYSQQQSGPPPPQMLQQRSASSSSIHYHGQHRPADGSFQQFSAHPAPGAHEVAAQYGHHPGSRDMAPPPAPEVPQQGFRRVSSAEEVRGRTPRHAAIVRCRALVRQPLAPPC